MVPMTNMLVLTQQGVNYVVIGECSVPLPLPNSLLIRELVKTDDEDEGPSYEYHVFKFGEHPSHPGQKFVLVQEDSDYRVLRDFKPISKVRH